MFQTFVAILLLSHLSGGNGSTINKARDLEGIRVERDTEDCEGVTKQGVFRVYRVTECISNTIEAFNAVIETPDEKPDYEERKTCNFLTSLMDCGQHLRKCYTEDLVQRKLDAMMKTSLDDLLAEVVHGEEYAWDSDKCPIVKAYKQRSECAADWHSCFSRLRTKNNHDSLRHRWTDEYLASKSCKIMTGVNDCRQLLTNCQTDEYVKNEWNKYMKMYSEMVKMKYFKAWDSQKCPVFMEYVESQADLEAVTVEETDSEDTEDTRIHKKKTEDKKKTKDTRRATTEKHERSGSDYVTFSTPIMVLTYLASYAYM